MGELLSPHSILVQLQTRKGAAKGPSESLTADRGERDLQSGLGSCRDLDVIFATWKESKHPRDMVRTRIGTFVPFTLSADAITVYA